MTRQLRILLVEDDLALANHLANLLQEAGPDGLTDGNFDGVHISAVVNQRHAAESVREREYDIVLLDLLFAMSSGGVIGRDVEPQAMTWLLDLRALLPRAVIIVLADHAHVEYAIRAIRDYHADDFLSKSDSLLLLPLRIKAAWRRVNRNINKIFLSSAGSDVSLHRDAAFQAIQSLGVECIRPEYLRASESWETLLAECSLVVLIIGRQYGATLSETAYSKPEAEYAAAANFQKPCLVFEIREDVLHTGAFNERDLRSLERQRQFRNRVRSQHLIHEFTSSTELTNKVVREIHRWRSSASDPALSATRLPSAEEFQTFFRTEGHFQEAIAGLLNRMPGTRGVQIVHDSSELQKTIIFYSNGPLGDQLLSVCLTWNESIDRLDQAQTLVRRLRETFNMTFAREDNELARVVRVYIMSPVDLASTNTLLARFEGIGHVEFMTGSRLLDLFKQYWPEYLTSGLPILQAYLSPDKPARVFVSYSHSDSAFRNDLVKHLTLLERNGQIESWTEESDDEEGRWSIRPDIRFEKADVILLLISPDFLASDYCYQVITKRALERHANGEAALVPILIRDAAINHTPLARFQVLPVDGKPVSSWTNSDKAWRTIVEGVQIAVRQMRSVSAPKDTLYISSLTIENIRCFSKASFDLDNSRFAMIFGENGQGKSTVLKSLALGLCPESRATALMGNLAGEFLRADEDEGRISIELKDSAGKKWLCVTVLRRADDKDVRHSGRASVVMLRRIVEPGFPADSIFVCGYGAGRRSIATADPASEYEIDSAVKTLFDYGVPLQNPELILRRAPSLGKSAEEMMLKIDAALELEPGSTKLDPTGIQIQGPWGSFIPLGALGDGYQGTLAWLVDFLGQQLLFDRDCPVSALSGVVLVDELEQHLHPRWQRNIIQMMHRQFPNVQFVATSHSPICAGGLADLAPDVHPRLWALKADENQTVAMDVPIPIGMRYDQIVTSPVIGLDTARDSTTTKYLSELRAAYDLAVTDPNRKRLIEYAAERLRDRSVTAAEDEESRNRERDLLSSLSDIKRALDSMESKRD